MITQVPVSFMTRHYSNAVGVEDWDLLVISSMTRETKETTPEIHIVHIQSDSEICLNQRLKCETAVLLSEATKLFFDSDTSQSTCRLVLQIVQSVEREVKISVGVFN